MDIVYGSLDIAAPRVPDLDNKWYGIFIWDSDSTSTISNCIIQNAARAIQVRSPATITSVNISDCRLRGISAAGAQADVVMTNVNVSGSEIAFRVADGATAAMTNCTATGSSIYAVRIASGADVTVIGGTIQSNDIGAYASCDSLCPTSAVFDGVAFSEACSVAVYIEGSVTGGIEDCTIAAITDGIVLDQVGTGFSITGNVIAIDANGITCDGCDTPMTGNIIQNCGTGIYCDNGATPVIRGNSIKLNTVGVGALNDANPDLGYSCSSSCDTTGACSTQGGNSFKTNSSHHIVNLSTGITVMAECNFFKKNTAAYFSGSIDRTPSSTSDPLPVSPFAGVPLPDRYALGHNFPNPFNPSTTVKYQIPPPGGDVAIRIYDVSGRLVRTLVSGRQPPGYYAVRWTGVNDRGAPVASGIYFLQMKAPSFVESRKVVLLK